MTGGAALTYNELILSDSPVLFWPLASDGSDISGNSYDGTLQNSPTFDTTDPFGDGCIVLNGTNQHVLRDTSTGPDTEIPSGAEAFTQEIIFRHDDAVIAASDALFYLGSGNATNYTNNGMHSLASGEMRAFFVSGGSELDSSSFNLSGQTWYYGGVTFNGTDRTMFVGRNGSYSSVSDTPAFTPNVTKKWAQAGAIRGGASIPWKGRLCKRAVYDYALSPSDIQARVDLVI
jgi:hypothetical protein